MYTVLCVLLIFYKYISPYRVLYIPYCILTISCVLYALLFANIHLNTIVRILGSIKRVACSAFFSSLLLPRNVLCTGSVCAILLLHTLLVYGYVMFHVPVFSWWEFMLLLNKAAFNILLVFAYANKGELLRGIAHHSGFKRTASYLHTWQIMSEYLNW